MKFDKKELQKLILGEPSTLSKVRDEIVSETHYNETHQLIFSENGKLYGFIFNLSKGEPCCEAPLTFYKSQIECVEVTPMVKTVVEFVPI